jgi:putative transposase
VSRQNFLAMVYKLGQRAAKRWRRLRGFEHLAEVIAGVKFKDGVRVETEEANRIVA